MSILVHDAHLASIHLCINPAMAPLDTFWTIPPIQDSIALHLTRGDLHGCIQASHSLHAAFIPFLWKEVEPVDHYTIQYFFDSGAQRRFRHHVKLLDIEEESTPEWPRHFATHGPYPNLMVLGFRYDSCSTLHMDLEFFDTAADHSLLTTLDIRGQIMSDKFLESFSKAMAKLTLLNTLYLGFDGLVTCRGVTQVLESCTRLETLEIECAEGVVEDTSLDFDEEPFDIDEANFRATNIKTLRLFLQGPSIDYLGCRFLEQCPALEELHWSCTFRDFGLPEAVSKVLLFCCPKLKNLRMKNLARGHGLFKILEGCPRLSSIHVNMPRDSGAIMNTFSMKHLRCLTELTVYDGPGIKPEDFFFIASSLPSLKTLRLRIWWAPGEAIQVESLKAMRKRTWVCKGLEALTLCLNRGPPGMRLLNAEGMGLFYSEIGGLSHLQDLNINVIYGHQELSESFVLGLDRLTGLAWLSRLYFSDCDGFLLTRAQLKRVVGLFPRLEFLSGLKGEWSKMSSRDVVKAIRAIGEEDSDPVNVGQGGKIHLCKGN